MNLSDHGKTARWHGIFFISVFTSAAAQGPNYPSYSNPNFKPSMTVTIIVLSVACFFIALFSFYIRRCSRDVVISRGGISLSRTRPAPPGLDASVIETFPTFLYSDVKGVKIGKQVLECAVCLNEFEDEETLRLLPKCNHVFHPECIDAWLSSHTTCPVCRADLIPDSSTPPVTLPTTTTTTTEADSSVTETDQTHNTDDHQVAVVINISTQNENDDTKPDVINIAGDQVRFPIKNGSIRSKSIKKGKRIIGRFPRSHSTGHSLVQPGDNHERFTLRLPEEVRKQILTGKLNRTTSCISFPTEESSGGWRNGSLRRSIGRRLESVAKSERWRFFWTAARSTKNGEGGGSVSFKSDGAGAGQGQSSLTRPPV